ncbi:aspartyl-tRNA(Asn)/glutamyl-tRNA(Gln) amidotransferase subunit A [Brevibacterium pityocampae]
MDPAPHTDPASHVDPASRTDAASHTAPDSLVDLVALAAALGDRTASAEQSVEAALQACHTEGRRLNAVVAPPHVPATQTERVAEHARTAAREVDSRRAGGTPRSRLDGVPFVIKDVIDLAGVTTTMGSTVRPEEPAGASAEVVLRFEEMGLVPVAKTTCHEHSYGILGEESAHGRGVNPLRPGFLTGGSSYGSAIAVAAGIVPVAIGTDTAGSVRVPAACAGITGFKPSLGRVPKGGVAPLSTTLDTVGFFTRTPAEMQLLWQEWTAHAETSRTEAQQVEGSNTLDSPTVRPRADAPHGIEPYTEAARTEAPLALGLLTTEAADCGEEWMARRAEPALAKLPGVALTPVDPAPFAFDRMPDIFARIRGYETYRIHRAALDAGRRDFQPQILRNLEGDARITDEAHAAAFEELDALRTAALAPLSGFDALVLPTLGTEPVEWADADQHVRNQLRLYTQLINLLGWPAISVPVDLLGGGSPVVSGGSGASGAGMRGVPEVRGAPEARGGEFPASVQLVMAPGRDTELVDLAVRLTSSGE